MSHRGRGPLVIALIAGAGVLTIASMNSGAWSSPAAEPIDSILLAATPTTGRSVTPDLVAVTSPPIDDQPVGTTGPAAALTALVAEVDEPAVRQPPVTADVIELEVGDVPTQAPTTAAPAEAPPAPVPPPSPAPTTAAPTTVVVTTAAPTTAAPTTAAPSTTQPPPPPSPSGGISGDAVALANAERVAAGLAPLAAHPAVEQAALAHSLDQAQMNAMSHTGSDGSDGGTRLSRAGYSWSTWGENVAAGYGSASSVVAGWMGSSGHRANILNPAFVHIGVAVAYAADGTPYWTMVLAA